MTWWKLFRANGDRAVAVGLAVLALLALYLGWVGLRQSAFPAEQIPYLVSGGLGAVILVGVAGTLWLSADLRDEWHKLDALEAAVDRLVEVSQDHPADGEATG